MKNNKGFTLIELLATLMIISIVTTITIYISLDVVSNSKEKVIETNKNNIESIATSYVIENQDKLLYSRLDDGDYEYQCVRVQELINMGYLDLDIKKSYVTFDKKVDVNNYIYISRNIKDKSIHEAKYVLDDSYNSYCNNISGASGSIYFSVYPDNNTWAREKTVSINYLSKSNNIKLINSYCIGTDCFDVNSNKIDDIEVTKNNTMIYAEIKKENEDSIANNSITISKIDRTKPTIKLKETNEEIIYNKEKAEVIININDKGSGIKYDFENKINDYLVITVGNKEIDNKNISFSRINNNEYKITIENNSIDGELVIKFKKDFISDNVGNKSKATTLEPNIIFDNTKPTIEYIAYYKDNASKIYNANGSETADSTILTRISASDSGSDISVIQYTLSDKENWQTFSFGSSSLTKNSENNTWTGVEEWTFKNNRSDEYYFRSCDNAGNCSDNISYIIKYKQLFKINYICDGVTIKSDDVESGSSYKILGGLCSKDYYTFNDWKNQNGNTYEVDKKITVTSDITLTAQWKVNTATIYYLIGPNENITTSNYSKSESINIDNITYNYIYHNDSKKTVTINYNDNLQTTGLNNGLLDMNSSKYLTVVKTGYYVPNDEEWKCLSGCTGEKNVYSQDENTYLAADFCDTINGNCIAYLGINWIPNIYKITLDKNNGSNGTSTIYEKYNNNFCLDSSCSSKMTTSNNNITIPTRTGYTFTGYYTEASGGTRIISKNGYIIAGKHTTFTSDSTIYAHWTPNIYKITLNKNNGSNGTSTIYEKYNNNFCLDSSCSSKMTTSNNNITIPTRTGYTFMGYYTEASGGTQIISSSGYIIAGKHTTFTSDSTIYAHWQENTTITIYYNADGGTLVTENSYGIDSDGYITKNSKRNFHIINKKGDTGIYGLYNFNNSSHINLYKYNYIIEPTNAWCTQKEGKGICFSQDGNLSASQLCNDKTGTCDSVTLYANWVKAVSFSTSGNQYVFTSQSKCTSFDACKNVNSCNIYGRIVSNNRMYVVGKVSGSEIFYHAWVKLSNVKSNECQAGCKTVYYNINKNADYKDVASICNKSGTVFEYMSYNNEIYIKVRAPLKSTGTNGCGSTCCISEKDGKCSALDKFG